MFEKLPFADDDANDYFEDCLQFICVGDEITELDLVAGEI